MNIFFKVTSLCCFVITFSALCTTENEQKKENLKTQKPINLNKRENHRYRFKKIRNTNPTAEPPYSIAPKIPLQKLSDK